MNIDIERLKHDREYWDEVAPEGATHCQPDAEADFFWYDADKKEALSKESGRWCFSHSSECYWASLTPRPSPSWDGEGLPPVGLECEICTKNGARFRVGVIEAYSRDKSAAMFDFDGLLDCASLDHCMFRPLKSEKDRVVEAAMEYAPWPGDSTTENTLKALYEVGFLKMPEGES